MDGMGGLEEDLRLEEEVVSMEDEMVRMREERTSPSFTPSYVRSITPMVANAELAEAVSEWEVGITEFERVWGEGRRVEEEREEEEREREKVGERIKGLEGEIQRLKREIKEL